MKMNKKGFTLIELLAVIVILAIIALIATPIILNVISEAQQNSDRNAAYGYIAAVEQSIAIEMMSNPNMSIPTTHNAVDADIVNGTAPSTVSLTLSDGIVTTGTITFANGNVFNVSNGEVTLSE